MPEGDTILWAATRMRPVLEGRAIEAVHTHARFGRDRWQERLSGQIVGRVDTRGKHLLIVFENGLVLHSHLRMTGAWDARPVGGRWIRSPGRAWLVLRSDAGEAVQFDGPVLELLAQGRMQIQRLLGRLGPDVLADEFDSARFLERLRSIHAELPLGEALLDQRVLAGIGNIWKSEGCWEAQLDPWRAVGAVSDQEVIRLVELVRPRMLESGTRGPRFIDARVYRRTGGPCRRCGGRIASRGQGDQNRTTYWCPGCQR